MPRRVVIESDEDRRLAKCKSELKEVRQVASEHRIELAEALGVKASPKDSGRGNMWLQLIAHVHLLHRLAKEAGIEITREQVLEEEVERSKREGRDPTDWTHPGRARREKANAS